MFGKASFPSAINTPRLIQGRGGFCQPRSLPSRFNLVDFFLVSLSCPLEVAWPGGDAQPRVTPG